MISLGRIVPEYGPAMASLALEIADAAESRHVYADANRLLKQIKPARDSVRTHRREVGELLGQLGSLSDDTINGLIDEAVTMEQATSGLRAQSRNSPAGRSSPTRPSCAGPSRV